jgi:hypothetical protein
LAAALERVINGEKTDTRGLDLGALAAVVISCVVGLL